MDLSTAMQAIVALTLAFWILGFGLKKIVRMINLI